MWIISEYYKCDTQQMCSLLTVMPTKVLCELKTNREETSYHKTAAYFNCLQFSPLCNLFLCFKIRGTQMWLCSTCFSVHQIYYPRLNRYVVCTFKNRQAHVLCLC